MKEENKGKEEKRRENRVNFFGWVGMVRMEWLKKMAFWIFCM